MYINSVNVAMELCNGINRMTRVEHIAKVQQQQQIGKSVVFSCIIVCYLSFKILDGLPEGFLVFSITNGCFLFVLCYLQMRYSDTDVKVKVH